MSPRKQKPAGVDALSSRQREVAAHLARGMTRKEIARSLGISTTAVEAHRLEALRRLGVMTTAELCYRLGREASVLKV